MSIHVYQKDHLKEHTGINLVNLYKTDAPISKDALRFWTIHDKDPFEVNLHPFATGQNKTSHKNKGGRKFVPFTGRPELIKQLLNTIEESLSYAAKATVKAYLNALRELWRILDAVEAAAMSAGQPMTRIEDVRLLNSIHSEFAHRAKIPRTKFVIIRSLVDTTRVALGAPRTYWEPPEETTKEKHIPPKEQRNELRFAIRQECRNVIEGWAHTDALLDSEEIPADNEDFILWRNAKYMRSIQVTSGKVLPQPEDLILGTPSWSRNSNGRFKLCLQESVFPNHWDAQAVWHQCLLSTGWNSSTLLSLDVNQNFLVDHFKNDPSDTHKRFVLSPLTYELVGEKERAGGKQQFITGQWKSLDGPGHLIKTYIERVKPLRDALKQELLVERAKLEAMKNDDYDAQSTQFSKIKSLEYGCRNVWLYVDRRGRINWIREEENLCAFIEGKSATFLSATVHALNEKLKLKQKNNNDKSITIQKKSDDAFRHDEEKAILSRSDPSSSIQRFPHVTAKDFRVWFADYVYRAQNGNILNVKKALNHACLSTSTRYTNTKILNQEASDAARKFLNILVNELDLGRMDLTILAHLYQYGSLSQEQETLLAEMRALPKSRVKVGCKDALHPPAHIKATANELCDVQRCMLCSEHAVILPESLDGIAMRTEELISLQAILPIETWLDDKYDIELKNNLLALRRFDLNSVLMHRKKWRSDIDTRKHCIPGLSFNATH